MQLTDLVEKIKNQGFHPIPMEAPIDYEESEKNLIAGSIDAFFEGAKALGSKVILVYADCLDEDDFEYELEYEMVSDDDDFDEDSGEDEAIDANVEDDDWDPGHSEEEDTEGIQLVDLSAISKTLKSFRSKLGENHTYLLTALSELMQLHVYVEEEWWFAFHAARSKAIEKVDGDPDQFLDFSDE